MSDYTNQHHDDFEAQVTLGLESAIKNGRRRDRKQLVLYVVGVLVLASVLWLGASYIRDRERFERAVNRNCYTTKANTESFNMFVETIVKTTKSSNVLSKSEIADRVRLYQALYQTVPYCPPLRK